MARVGKIYEIRKNVNSDISFLSTHLPVHIVILFIDLFFRNILRKKGGLKNLILSEYMNVTLVLLLVNTK